MSSLPNHHERHAAPCSGRRLRILVVDDHPTNRRYAQRVLQKAGHDVSQAPGGLEAVQAGSEQRFDVILMDIEMPGMDGIEAARRIRAGGDSAETPIITVTAHALPEMRARCSAAGMQGFLPKPYVPRDLLDMIEQTVMEYHGKPSGRSIGETAAESGAGNGDDGEGTVDVGATAASEVESGEFDCELAEIHLEVNPPLFESVMVAVRRRDFATLQFAAHKLRGSLLLLEADRGAEAALQLELCGRRQSDSGLDRFSEQLTSEFRAFNDYVGHQLQLARSTDCGC